MLFTEKQSKEYIEWFKENYGQYCPVTKDGRLGVPVIYCDNPEEEEAKHKKIWLDKIKELMHRDANRTYVHRGGRKECYAEVQFNSLRLFHGPEFRKRD